jgi:hypothetical protein
MNLKAHQEPTLAPDVQKSEASTVNAALKLTTDP